MKIFTTVTLTWNGSRYVLDTNESLSFEYSGPVDLLCGATAAQNNIQQQQQSFFGNAQQQAQQLFGNDSQVFGDLMKTFAPTVAAGPSQLGYSAGELSDLNSQAITGTGQAYQNAKAATGDAISAQGGGVSQLPSGATVGVDANLASSAANQTASELTGIKQADYQQGNQNYNNAVQGLANAGNVFNSATNAENATTNAGSAAANTANQVAQENNSWVQGVTGALGGIAGAAMGVATGGLSTAASGFGQAGLNLAQGLSNEGASGFSPENPDGGASVE